MYKTCFIFWASPASLGLPRTMDHSIVTAVFLLCMALLYKLVVGSEKHRQNLPPSPPSLPIVGHLHLLHKPLHRALAKLSSLHGPVLFLRFGSRPVLLVSSPSAAEECFTTNDVVFANRPALLLVKYSGANLIWSSYGSHWRDLRRISTVEIFSSHRIQRFCRIRTEEVKYLASRLHRDCGPEEPKKVELRTRIFELALNVMMRIVTGKRYCGDEVRNAEEARRFKRTVEETLSLSGGMVVGDYLPWLRWMGRKRTEKKLAELKRRRDGFLRGVVEERRRGREAESGILDAFLEHYEDDVVMGTLMDILMAGTHTLMVTVEWGMSLLLDHPEAMRKAGEEIRSRVGLGKLLEESDVPHLPYLWALINETLRLHPPGPLLAPHESSRHTVLRGYHIPKGTMLLVNVWAIHRDDTVWEEPTRFAPERFLREEEEGSGCNFFPFGLGRRRCPGEGLAMKQLGLVLGTLIQCFHWEKAEVLDMTEGDCFSMSKAASLQLMCRTRKEMLPFLS